MGEHVLVSGDQKLLLVERFARNRSPFDLVLAFLFYPPNKRLIAT